MQSLLYNLVWLLCVKYPSHTKYRYLSLPLLILSLLIQFILFLRYQALTGVIPVFIISLMGFIGSQSLCKLKILRFKGQEQSAWIPPYWFLAIWLSFMLYVYPLLIDYQRYPMLIGLLSGGGFAFAYWLAERLGAVIKTSPSRKCFTIIAILHGVFFLIIETLLCYKVI